MDNQLVSKLENCTFVKTILMIIVLLYHACAFWTGEWFPALRVEIKAGALGILSIWLNTFHVYAFTLVSGFLFSYLKWEKRKYQNFKSFISSKVKRLIIPYVFVSIVWAIPIGQFFYHYSIIQLFRKYVLATGPSQLWFLMMLFWCFVGAFILSNTIEKSSFWSIAIAVGSFIIGVAGGLVIPNVFCIWTAFQYFPLFVLGMKMRHWDWLERIPSGVYIGIDVMLFTFWMIIRAGESTFAKLLNVGVGFPLHIVGALMAWSFLQWVGRKVNWSDNKAFKMLSSFSMPIYLFQQIIYIIIYWLNGKVNPYLNAGINFVIAFVCSLLISFLLSRWKVTRILIGEKG